MELGIAGGRGRSGSGREVEHGVSSIPTPESREQTTTTAARLVVVVTTTDGGGRVAGLVGVYMGQRCWLKEPELNKIGWIPF